MTGHHRELVLAGPHSVGLRDADDVEPGPGELLVAPEAVGVCGTDVELVEGTMAYLRTGQASYPITPGHEWAGTVLAVGPGVTGFGAGDRVVGEAPIGCGECARCHAGDYHLCPDRRETGFIRQPGALTERLVYPARGAHLVPPHVSTRDAALVEPLAVAYRAVRRVLGGAVAPDRLLVVGGGSIGLLAAMAARALGVARVLVVEPQPGRRDVATALGYDTVEESDGAWPFVVEASGREAGMQAALSSTGVGGRVVLVGLCGAAAVPVDVDRIVLNDQTVMGSLSSPGVWPEVIGLVASGRVRPGALVTHTFTLDEAAAAFAQAAGGRPGTVKVQVLPQAAGRP